MYTKFQIALQYFPDLMERPEVAIRRLNRAIVRCRPLQQALNDIGYDKWARRFSSREVELIYEYLGEP